MASYLIASTAEDRKFELSEYNLSYTCDTEVELSTSNVGNYLPSKIRSLRT